MTIKVNKDCSCGCGGAGGCATAHGNKFRVHLDGKDISYKLHKGRKHLVVPVVMARADVVMNNALTPKEELIPAHWNGVHVTSGHPVDKGPSDFISVNGPDVAPKWSVGVVKNSRLDGTKLKGEVWIDLDRVQKVNPRIVTHVTSGKNVDVSTGFFSKDDDVTGELNGRRYTMVTRQLRPDHLALLLDESGACSWADGCGLRTNYNENHDPPTGRFTGLAGGALAGVAAAAAVLLAPSAVKSIGRAVSSVAKKAPKIADPTEGFRPTNSTVLVTGKQSKFKDFVQGATIIEQQKHLVSLANKTADKGAGAALKEILANLNGPSPSLGVAWQKLNQISATTSDPKLKKAVDTYVHNIRDVALRKSAITTFSKKRGTRIRTNMPPLDWPRQAGRWIAGVVKKQLSVDPVKPGFERSDAAREFVKSKHALGLRPVKGGSASGMVRADEPVKGVWRTLFDWGTRRGIAFEQLTKSKNPADKALRAKMEEIMGGFVAGTPYHSGMTAGDLTGAFRQIRRLRDRSDLTDTGRKAIAEVAGVLDSLKSQNGLLHIRKGQTMPGIKTNAPPEDQPRDKGKWVAAAIGATLGAGIAAAAIVPGALGKAAKAARAARAAGAAAARRAAKSKAAETLAKGLPEALKGVVPGKTLQGSFMDFMSRRVVQISKATAAADREAKKLIGGWIGQISDHTRPEDLTRMYKEVKSAIRTGSEGAGKLGVSAMSGLQAFKQHMVAVMNQNGIRVNKVTGEIMTGKTRKVAVVPVDDDFKVNGEAEIVEVPEEAFHENEDNDDGDDSHVNAFPMKKKPAPDAEDPEDAADGGADEAEEGAETPAEEDTTPPAEKLSAKGKGKPSTYSRKRPVNNQEVSMTDELKAMVADAVKETVTVTLGELVTNAIKEAKAELITADQQAALKLASNQAQLHKDGLISKIKANSAIPEEVIKTFTMDQLEATAAGILPAPDFTGRMAANAQKLDDEDPAIKAMTAGADLAKTMLN